MTSTREIFVQMSFCVTQGLQQREWNKLLESGVAWVRAGPSNSSASQTQCPSSCTAWETLEHHPGKLFCLWPSSLVPIFSGLPTFCSQQLRGVHTSFQNLCFANIHQPFLFKNILGYKKHHLEALTRNGAMPGSPIYPVGCTLDVHRRAPPTPYPNVFLIPSG